MRLKINGKLYPSLELDAVSLRDILRFEGEVRDFRADAGWAWPDVLGTSQDFADLTDDEVSRHPKWPWFLASMIWASRRLAGEEVTFDEALGDLDSSGVDFVEEPGDHKPGKAKGAKKPRKASAPAVAPVKDDEPSLTSVPEESGSPSIAG